MLIVEDLMLDTKKLRAFRNDRPLRLNPTNIEILTLLMRRSPGVVRREEISTILWGENVVKNTSGVGTRLHEIRKIVDDGAAFPLVHTIYGIGYQLCRLAEA
jgi:DNA-binding winged helix-turn-helix (wHTH) protein